MSRYASSSYSSNTGGGNSSRYHHDSHRHRHDSRDHYRDDYNSSRNSNNNNTQHHFSLSESDFQRDAVLQRQRYLSPAVNPSSSSAESSSSYSTSRNPNNNSSNSFTTSSGGGGGSSSSYHRRDSGNNSSANNSNNNINSSQQQQQPHRRPFAIGSGTWSLDQNPSNVSAGFSQSQIAAVVKAAVSRAAASSPAPPTPVPVAVSAPAVKKAATVTTAAESVASRVRSKSKSRATKMAPASKKPVANTQFIALGQREKTLNPYKATFHGSDKYRSVRSRSRSVGASTTTTARAVSKAATANTTIAAGGSISASSTQKTAVQSSNSSREEEARGRVRERERELERERAALPEPKTALTKSSSSKSSHHTAAAAEEKSVRSKSKARSHKSKSSRRSSSSSSSRGRRRTTSDYKRSKSTMRKASAKRTSPSPSSSSSSSQSPPPRRQSSRRSKSKSKASRHSESKSKKKKDDDDRSRAKSKSRARSSTVAATSSSVSGASEDIDEEIATTKKKLKDAQKELQSLQDEQRELSARIEAKSYQIRHLELDLETVEKRKRIEFEYSSRAGTVSAHSAPKSSNASNSSAYAVPPVRESDRRKRSVSRARGVSKRPCIVDTDESDDDDEVVILDPVEVKQEKQERSRKRQRSSSKSRSGAQPKASKSAAASLPVQVPMDTSLTENAERTEIPDYFWGKADTPKLLAQHRVRTIPDGSVRKGRHLAFNPKISDYFATSSDDGGLIMWNYERPKHEITKMATFAPTSFRKDNQCAESMVWSPDGNRLAMAFRDPINGQGEFSVVLLHELELGDPDKPQLIPSDRVTSMSTTLHSRGISAIEWIPIGSGSSTTSRSLVTAGSDHAVILWEEHGDVNSVNDYKWDVLHREHRSEVKSICVHSQRQAIYTGGFDGQVIRYDLNKSLSTVVMERRKPNISKINAVLEHPHNPNILLVSSVEQSEHSILLHDLRQRYNSSRDDTMTLSWVKSSDSRSMSQYIVPRWSPAGMHVSCGSKSGLVNIWDVRVRGPSFPIVLPQQSVAVHQKTVLHATWHPRYNAIFSVSNDRTLGLLTFR